MTDSNLRVKSVVDKPPNDNSSYIDQLNGMYKDYEPVHYDGDDAYSRLATSEFADKPPTTTRRNSELPVRLNSELSSNVHVRRNSNLPPRHRPGTPTHSPGKTRHSPGKTRHSPGKTRHSPGKTRHSPEKTTHRPRPSVLRRFSTTVSRLFKGGKHKRKSRSQKLNTNY